MNTPKKIIAFIAIAFISPLLIAQGSFNLEAYRSFLEANQNMTYDELTASYSVNEQYFSGEGGVPVDGFEYLDSLIIKYELTEDELGLLENNQFVVTQRLSYPSFGQAYADIFHKDMPVMVTTDAILHALHSSYDRILVALEKSVLIPNLEGMLQQMYASLPDLIEQHSAIASLEDALHDVDLYVAVAYSLIKDEVVLPHIGSETNYEQIMTAIAEEAYAEMPLFSYVDRKLDFSQFKVRSHYTETEELGRYFKTMMWLGRIDFLLTDGTEEDNERMNLAAYMLNALLDLSNTRDLLEKNDEILTFFVGEDDNISPAEYHELTESLDINAPDYFLDSANLANFQGRMKQNNAYGQRIMSSIIMVNPFSAEPEELPISFRLMGQKFIIDSYVLSQVVFDRVVHEGKKVMRMMPDPLDALFALGNDDALHFLKEEMETYPYAMQLGATRYLIEAYDEGFWNQSMYNLWLNSIRKLNPIYDTTGYPGFMKTAAWRQEKMNTQLASWAQLRHDNLLYAKQSYTAGIICSFPYSYVEPYPEFYAAIAKYAKEANLIFAEVHQSSWEMTQVNEYFTRLYETMDMLENIAKKQLTGEMINTAEAEFLKTMLITSSGVCGSPPYQGWYINLFYDPLKSLEEDNLIADIHTQPTDEFGGMVGRVLHVATGRVNLGVFLAPSNKSDEKIAYVGPVFSYYEKITDNFTRLSDEDWQSMVADGDVPVRPEWTDVYMADKDGKVKTNPVTLPYKQGLFSSIPDDFYAGNFELKCFPNPVKDLLKIEFRLEKPAAVSVNLFDVSGRKMASLTEFTGMPGVNTKFVTMKHFTKGIYFLQVSSGGKDQMQRVVLQ